MALDIYFTIGDVEGNVTNMNHKGWIALETCDWGLARTRRRGEGGQAGAALTAGNEIRATKLVGLETSALMALCASGRVCDHAEISIAPGVAKREIAKKFVRIKMTHAFIKSINAAAAHENSTIREEIVIGFRQMSFEYFIPANRDSASVDKAVESRTLSFDFAAQAVTEMDSEKATVEQA